MKKRIINFFKKYDTVLYILSLIIAGCLLVGIVNSYACSGEECKSDGNVMYSGEGNKGDIFVFDCNKNDKSNTDIGKWVNPSTISGLKGDKGEQGKSGLNGTDGDKGDNGLNGLNGKDGVDGLKGDKGDTGANGLDFDPAEVIRLDNRISTETMNRIDEDTILQNIIDDVKSNLTQETKQRKNADTKLGNRITNETKSRIKADTREKQQRILEDKQLQTNINKETKDRKSADKVLQKNINTETSERKSADKTEKKARILGDKKLQDNINIVDNNSQNRDINLQNNINSESSTRESADNSLNDRINDTNGRVDDVEHRVSKLEKTQYVVRTEVKFVREKHLEIGVYGEYNVGRSTCSEVGINIVIPFGESYLDRENKKINTRLDRLEQKVGVATVIERTVDNKGMVKSISISEGQLSVHGEF